MNHITYPQNYVTPQTTKAPIFTKQVYSNNNSTMKDTPESKKPWTEQKGILKQRFAILTDNDLMLNDGNKDKMLSKIQIKLGKTKEQLHKILEAL